MAPPAAPTKAPPKATATAHPESSAAEKIKKSYLPAPIEDVNAAIAQVWEDIGVWKKLAAQMNNNMAIKEHILRVCNMQEMPLIGVDIIPTQQGLKLYVNSEGAKFNRERYLANQGRRLIERKITILPYDKVPYADPARDKPQGRIFFEIETVIEDVDQKEKIVEAVSKGIIPADKVKDVLEQLKIITRYVTHSSFSNQSEKFTDNRQPDAILKKGTTQCHRRADLEISSQCVIPEDEEPKDAVFLIKDTPGIVENTPSKLEMASTAAESGASMPTATLAPDKVAEQPVQPPKVDGAAGPSPEELKEAASLMDKVNSIFNEAKVGKADRMKWFTTNGFPIRKDQLTSEVLKKAVAALEKEFKKTSLLPPTQAAQEPAPDPARSAALSKVFGLREKAGFDNDEALRAWAKKRFGKGLSEMAATEIQIVGDQVKEFASFLSNYTKWGLPSELALKTYVSDGEKKEFHDVTSAELAKCSTDLDEFIT